MISVKESWLGSYPTAGVAWLVPSCSLTARHPAAAMSVRDHASGEEPPTLQRFLLLSALSAASYLSEPALPKHPPPFLLILRPRASQLV